MIISLTKDLEKSGVDNMNVNGSSVNQVYSYSPGTGVEAVSKIMFILEDAGTTSLTNFGAIAALTNGIQLSITIGGIQTVLFIAKSNADLMLRCDTVTMGSGATDTLGNPNGFGQSNDFVFGSFDFENHITLTDTDSIEMTIRDNLTAIGTLRASIVIVKDI